MWALLKGSGRAVLLGVLFFHGMLSSVGDEAGSKEVSWEVPVRLKRWGLKGKLHYLGNWHGKKNRCTQVPSDLQRADLL